MSPATASSAQVLAVPAETCFWGVLAPATDAAPEAELLRFRFEAVLPFPIERLQCAFYPLADGRWLAVGLPCEQVRALRDGPAGGSAWVICPDGLPACIPAEQIGALRLEALNLLHGVLEPRLRLRWRRRVLATAVAAAVLVSAILLAGGEASAALWRSEAAAVERDALAWAEAGAPAGKDGARLPPMARLLQAYRQRQGRGDAAGVGADALAVMAALWERWPEGSGVQVRDVALRQRRLLVRGVVATPAQAGALGKAFGDLTVGDQVWRMDPPELPRSQGGETQVLLAWRASAPPRNGAR